VRDEQSVLVQVSARPAVAPPAELAGARSRPFQ
jgi:hypothetical protein